MPVKDPAQVSDILAGIFSWAVLATASIIISGMFLAARFPLSFVKEGKLSIPLGVLSLKAVKDQVVLGLMAFFLALACMVFFGGAAAYEFFRAQAGIDIGQWNSLCIISSVLSMFSSFVIFLISGIFVANPLVNDAERTNMLDRLKELGDG